MLLSRSERDKTSANLVLTADVNIYLSRERDTNEKIFRRPGIEHNRDDGRSFSLLYNMNRKRNRQFNRRLDLSRRSVSVVFDAVLLFFVEIAFAFFTFATFQTDQIHRDNERTNERIYSPSTGATGRSPSDSSSSSSSSKTTIDTHSKQMQRRRLVIFSSVDTNLNLLRPICLRTFLRRRHRLLRTCRCTKH
jgi:hypothetical protein